MKSSSVLGNLRWPFAMIDRTGLLNFGKLGDDGSSMEASVKWDGKSLSAVALSNGPDGEPRQDLRLAWNCEGGVAAPEAFSIGGAPATEAEAFEAFQSFLSGIDQAPSFRPLPPKAAGPSAI